VRILLDDINARGIARALMALDEHPAIEVRLYNPFRNRKGLQRTLEMIVRAFRVNHRMHNKAWIADGRVAILGGRNLGDEYFGAAEQVNFRDLDLGLLGAEVAQAERIFDAYWNSATAVPIRSLKKRSRIGLEGLATKLESSANETRARPYLERIAALGGIARLLDEQRDSLHRGAFRVIADPPIKWKNDDRSLWMIDKLLPQLATAEQEVLLVSPYFVPGTNGSAHLVALRRSGVATRVLTNSLAATDVAAVHAGYARYRPILLSGGVELYELKSQGDTHMSLAGSRGASLHTKALLVDGRRGFVGSFNLDPRSVNLNTEMGVLFESETVGRRLAEEFQRLIDPRSAYRLGLDEGGGLHWSTQANGKAITLRQEPDADPLRRIGVWLLGRLPIESQL
jgi:cardiolipin synthase C